MLSPSEVMTRLVALCKRRGFVFPASEIYGGLNGFWDFGPLGVQLKNRLRDNWWRAMVECPPDGPDGRPLSIVGLDSAIIQHPRTWEASGHVGGFADPMQTCRKCKKLVRSDHIADLYRELGKPLPESQPLPCPYCGGDLTEPRQFNLMFESRVGAVEDDASKVYLRPETAQGIFLNYKNVLDTSRVKIPFGVAQIGKSFRNEVTPRNFIFRTREFEQMEMEFFCAPEDGMTWYEFWVAERLRWWESVGVARANLFPHVIPADEVAHYSKGTTDIEYKYPFTDPHFGELEGVAYRTDYDLTQHQTFSKTPLDYIDQENSRRYIPHVIEPASGLTRGVLVLLCEGYRYDESRASPEWLKIKPSLAPITCGIFPLVNKDGMPEVAEKLYRDLRRRFVCQYDPKQSIGKRYARMDEAGTPFCVTVDGTTLTDQTVTIRNRDTAQQERVALSQVEAYITARLGRE